MSRFDMHATIPIKVSDTDLIRIDFLPNNLTHYAAEDESDEEMPWYKFYQYIAKRLGWNIEEIDVSNVFVTNKTYIVLSRYEYQWLSKSISYFSGMSKDKKESTWGMHSLMYSPNVIAFQTKSVYTPEDPKNGRTGREFYIRKPGKGVIR